MNWHGTERRAAIILGAGATRGAIKHVLLNNRRIKPPLNGDFFPIVEHFAKAKGAAASGRYERLHRFFTRQFGVRGRWPLPMEEAFSLLYVSKDFPGIYQQGRGRRRSPGDSTEIEDFLWLTFSILIEIERGSGATEYDNLVAALTPNDSVISLNYDTLLDSSLFRAGWNPSSGYGFSVPTARLVKHCRVLPEAHLKNVELLKLHGSMNWYVRATGPNSLAKVFKSKPTKIVFANQPRLNGINGLRRQIVPPIYGKFFEHAHWERLWRRAHKALVDSELLFIVGSSLVDTDFHFSGMIRHAILLRKRAHNPFREIVLADRSLKVRRKWAKLLEGCARRVTHARSFEELCA